MTLQPNSTLQGGKYRIEKVLGQGGFGITYLAEQTMLERKVAIKEFFMREFCERDESTSHVTLGSGGIRATVDRFREKFLKEARNIAKLKHPHIIQILDVFEENGTAYYVMEYAENGSLSTLVADNKALPEAQATRYILQVADALAYIHQRKMNHLDIKPSNIMLNGEDEPLLIDFGLSKQYDEVGQQTSTTPVGLSEGYAPMEQYKQGGVTEFSPETDIYALGATFFKLLTGKTPPGASDVYDEGLPVEELEKKGVSQAAIDAIIKAMEPRRKNRMHDVMDFINMLKEGMETSHVNTNNHSDSDNVNNDESTIIIPQAPIKEERHEQKKAEPSSGFVNNSLFLVLFAIILAIVFAATFSGGMPETVTSVEMRDSVDGDTTEIEYKKYERTQEEKKEINFASIKYALLDAPNFNGSMLKRDMSIKQLTLKLVSCKQNNITDNDLWLKENVLQINRSRSTHGTYINTGGYHVFLLNRDEGYEKTKVIVMDGEETSVFRAYDFEKFRLSPKSDKSDVCSGQYIIDIIIENNIMYVAHAGSTYSKTYGYQTGYISAINMYTDEVVWTSQPLTNNSGIIALVNNSLIVGYGFSLEPDYLYILDKHSGRRVQTIPLKQAADCIIVKDKKVYVRAYNYDYVFSIQ